MSNLVWSLWQLNSFSYFNSLDYQDRSLIRFVSYLIKKKAQDMCQNIRRVDNKKKSQWKILAHVFEQSMPQYGKWEGRRCERQCWDLYNSY